jgi:hypothetical protein
MIRNLRGRLARLEKAAGISPWLPWRGRPMRDWPARLRLAWYDAVLRCDPCALQIITDTDLAEVIGLLRDALAGFAGVEA